MHPSPKLAFERLQLRLHSFSHRLSHHLKLPLPCLSAYMRESKKVERLRFAFSALLSVLRCLPSELDQSSLFFIQRQVEPAQSFAQFYLKQFCLAPMLKPHNKVVCVAHYNYFSSCSSLPPLLHPLIEPVVKIDVRKHRAYQPSLRRPFFTCFPFPCFQHSCSQPLLYEHCQPSVSYSVLDELHQPFVGDGVEEPSYVCIQHPVDLSLPDSYRQRVQRFVRSS